MRRRLLAILVAFVGAAASALGQQTSVIREIVVRGNENVTQEAILAQMRTKVGQPYIQAQLDQDKQALEATGFFQAVDVRARALELDAWQVVVEVQEYPLVKEIRVTGNSSVKTDEILKVLEIQPGQIFNLKKVQPSIAAIRKLYTDRGFFANVDDFSPLEESPNTLNVSIIELTVGNVTVEGAVRTKPSVMRKLIKTRPGDTFSARRWEADLRRVYGTQWFEEVRSSERMSEEGIGKVDLTVNVKETRTATFNIGAQVDPRSGFAGFIRLDDANFLGTGQTIGVGYLQSAGGGGPSLDLTYRNPFLDSRDTSLSVQLYSRVIYRFAGTVFGSDNNPTDEDRYTERRTGFTTLVGRPVGRDLTASVGLRAEEITTEDLGDTSSDGFIQQDGRVAVLTLAAVRNRRDVDIDPSRGDWLRLAVEPGFSDITKVGGLFPDPDLVGSGSFVRSTLEYRAYFTDQPPRGTKLDDPRRVLAFRARYGVITGSRLPFFEQFFAGGSDTVRGYREDRFWGKQTLLTTVEYRYPIQKAFNAVLFVDYGGAWGGYGSVNDYTQSGSFDLHLGYGLGFSFRTPLGPIRLDFGFNEEGGSRTHFLIGMSF
ncbi:MAG: FtsQ-type POTRA domain-containing protein [Fimbriimonadales bacterium]|nr:FtsQ-type POTRA domain-containing protein [Fimbriimonadales bacterium]